MTPASDVLTRSTSVRARRTAGLVAAAVLATGAALPARSVAAAHGSAASFSADHELSETTRLDDRRSLVVGDRAYTMGAETGLYPASGWHVRGEMGGFWTPPVKLLDGMWFAVDGAWLGTDVTTSRYTSGSGYQRFAYQQSRGVRIDRVDFVPDGKRAAVVGLSLRSD